MRTHKNKIFDDLDEELKFKPNYYKTNVIALLKVPEDKLDDKVKDLKKILGEFEVDDTYKIISGFSGKLTKKQIDDLSKLDESIQIEPDLQVTAFLDTATSSFGVQKARTDFSVTGDRDGSPSSYSTDDVVIAIIDTGIDKNHVDLDGGKILGWHDFVNGQPTAYDDNGHGTHVASIAAGDGQGNPSFKGVAPGAALVGVKVLDRMGSGTISGVLSGVDWVVANKALFGIDVLNLSLGTSGCSDGNDSLSLALDNAVNNGIVAVVAAGNAGPGTCTVASPAASRNAIAVGAMADTGENGFFLASFSSRGPTLDGRIKPDVVAPGVSITAAAANTNSGYTTKSGTSMATPFVAGEVALMLDANPSLTPASVKDKILSNSVDWGAPNKDIDYGAGRLDGYETVRNSFVTIPPGNNNIVPTHTIISDSLPGTGSVDNWTIDVTDISFPIAITMIMPTWTSSISPDFDIILFDPTGTQVANSLGVNRQETIGVPTQTTGTYALQVTSFRGSGPYVLDISSGSTPILTVPSIPQNLVATSGNTQVALTWSAPASNGGAAITDYKVEFKKSSDVSFSVFPDGISPSTGTTVNGLTNGQSYDFKVSAINSVGTGPATSPVTATPTAPDSIPPSITFATGNTASTTGEAIVISAVITDNVLVSGAAVHYTPIGGIETTIPMVQGTSWSAAVPVASDKVGTISYFITATDPSGNTARDPPTGTYSITITDNDPPTVTITQPTNGAIVGGTISILATASDNIGVASVEFLDGTTSIFIDNTPPYSASWSTALTIDGTHTITTKALDAAGNSASDMITVTVDNQAPTAPSSLTGTPASPTQIDLSWTASSDNTAVTGYQIFRDNTPVATVTGTTYSDTALSAGTTYTYFIKAFDVAGNVSPPSSSITAVTPSLPSASINISSHSETVRNFRNGDLSLRSIVTATTTGNPSNVKYTYTFDDNFTFDDIKKTNMVVNGKAFNIKRLGSVTGNTISFNLSSFTFNDGDSVKIQLDSKYKNVGTGVHTFTATFIPGTSDSQQIVISASTGD